jgi:hypothetical protein
VTSAALKTKLLGAVERALAGDWQTAHLTVQEHEEDGTANWIHAVCHRMEGDVSNARYWYGRIGREYREEVSTEVELREIQAALTGGRPSAPRSRP